MHFQLKNFDFKKPELVYPLDKDGNRLNLKYGIGKLVKTLGGTYGIPFMSRIKESSKYKLTSNFETESGQKFVSVKLRNFLMKY